MTCSCARGSWGWTPPIIVHPFRLSVPDPPTCHPPPVSLQSRKVSQSTKGQKGADNIWRHGLGSSWCVKVSLTLKSLNLEVILLFMCVWPKHPRLRGLNLKIDFKSDALLCKMNVVALFFLLLFSQPNLILFCFFVSFFVFFLLQMWKMLSFYLYPHVHSS